MPEYFPDDEWFDFRMGTVETLGDSEARNFYRMLRELVSRFDQLEVQQEDERPPIGFNPPPTKKKRGSPRKQKTTKRSPQKKKR
jgi:hypothetical protein